MKERVEKVLKVVGKVGAILFPIAAILCVTVGYLKKDIYALIIGLTLLAVEHISTRLQLIFEGLNLIVMMKFAEHQKFMADALKESKKDGAYREMPAEKEPA